MSDTVDWTALSSAHHALDHLPSMLRESAKYIRLTQGETVFRMGEKPGAMLYLLSGEIQLIRRSRTGTEIILQRARGGFFAEASLESGRYHCDAVAAEPTEMLRFPGRVFREMIALDAAFRNDWITHLTREVRKLRTQCERLSLNGAAERILHYIECEGTDGTIVLSQTKKAWAAELGLSHEVLYRTLRRMQEQNLLKVEDRQISLGPIADK